MQQKLQQNLQFLLKKDKIYLNIMCHLLYIIKIKNYVNIIINLYMHFIYMSLNLLKKYIVNYNFFLQFEEKSDFLKDHFHDNFFIFYNKIYVKYIKIKS